MREHVAHRGLPRHHGRGAELLTQTGIQNAERNRRPDPEIAQAGIDRDLLRRATRHLGDQPECVCADVHQNAPELQM
jgi:hypothetical protein